jgi:hypothetical protein
MSYTELALDEMFLKNNVHYEAEKKYAIFAMMIVSDDPSCTDWLQISELDG